MFKIYHKRMLLCIYYVYYGIYLPAGLGLPDCGGANVAGPGDKVGGLPELPEVVLDMIRL